MNTDWSKVHPTSFVALLFVALFVFPLGALFLYVYKPALFFGLELYKLLLLSAGITMPLLVVNYFLSGPILNPASKTITNRVTHMLLENAAILGCLLTAIVVSLAILAGYFGRLPIRTGIVITLIAEIGVILACLLTIWKELP